MASIQDTKAAFKLAQLRNVLSAASNNKIFEKILAKEGNIDYGIPSDSPVRYSRPQEIGYTALHLAYTKGNHELFVNLLAQGADFTKTNKDGETLLHMTCPEPENCTGPVGGTDSFFSLAFSAYVNSNNFSNPCDKNGLSHFHIACMTSDTRAVELYIEHGASVDEPVSVDSKSSPGFTPLHFAAICTNTKVVQILLAQGANMNTTDANGMTILHILIKQRLGMFDLIRTSQSEEEDCYKKLQGRIEENDKIINMVLENMSIDNDCCDSIGLTNFHVACMLKDTSVALLLADQEEDLDHCINVDSPLWPGYTTLHFAAHIDLNRVEMLINEGANMLIKDSEGTTPLDVCIERYKIEDICNIISLHPDWRNILFSDGQTKLLSFVRTLVNRNNFKKLLDNSIRDINMCIPMNSPLWPGYTPLHLAALFADKSRTLHDEDSHPKKEVDLQIIRLCLKNGADLSKQDKQGRTAIHLAFRLNKIKVIGVIFRHSKLFPNVSDDENLSHLHIVCALTNRINTFKKCSLINSNVNEVYKGLALEKYVWPGATPLHACLANSAYEGARSDIIRILLKSGADPYIQDAQGLTPIHWLLDHGRSSPADQMLKPELKDCVVEEFGIGHLHIASYLHDKDAVKRLLENGANINLTIKCNHKDEEHPLSFLGYYDGCTPLHVSSHCNDALHKCIILHSPTPRSKDVQELLIEHGANVFPKNADGAIALDDPKVLKLFVKKVWNDVDLQRRMEQEFGWSRLHLACHLLLIDGFEDMVKVESKNLNAQVFLNSPIWRGSTPLHLLMHLIPKNYLAPDEKIELMLKLLLENGADVTVVDEKNDSSIGVLVEFFARKDAYKQAATLIKYHKTFNVNPVNSQGISHFHVACYLNDFDAVKGFLSHGVDVNRPVDYFSDWNPGYTPLQLASQLQVVDLLINYGADIHIENVEGSTAIHKAFHRHFYDEDIIAKLVENGADINSENLKGKTPFEIAIEDDKLTMEKLLFCMRQGCFVNSCNPISGEGYLGIILGKLYLQDENLHNLLLETIMNEKSTNILGRTTLHNLMSRRTYVSYDAYASLIEKVIKNGCDVDAQDNEGKTPLHLATKYGSKDAVVGLLRCGADINVLDINGKPAISDLSVDIYTWSHQGEDIKKVFTVHAYRLFLFELDLCNFHKKTLRFVSRDIAEHSISVDFRKEIAACRKIELGVRSMHLLDFLSETGAVRIYRSLNQAERHKIDKYFESIDSDTRLQEIKGFLKLQYRKAVKRIELFSLALNSLRLLLGFQFPDLCAENVFQYLRNSDLQNIISTGIENQDINMEVD